MVTVLLLDFSKNVTDATLLFSLIVKKMGTFGKRRRKLWNWNFKSLFRYERLNEFVISATSENRRRLMFT